MNLIIDTRNGLAGDIACAGLLGLGADQENMVPAMTYAAELIGPARILPFIAEGNYSMEIELDSNFDPLSESTAFTFLDDIFDRFDILPRYQDFGYEILATICNAERYVHLHDPRLGHMLTHPHHHPRHPAFAKSRQEALLHETQDILVDITGFVTGLQELEIHRVSYISHVNVGNGSITFSHGTFEVPAPATKHILETHGIVWLKSEHYESEMTTPTGASILAGSRARRILGVEELKIIEEVKARGSRRELPAIGFYLA